MRLRADQRVAAIQASSSERKKRWPSFPYRWGPRVLGSHAAPSRFLASSGRDHRPRYVAAVEMNDGGRSGHTAATHTFLVQIRDPWCKMGHKSTVTKSTITTICITTIYYGKID